MTATPPAEALRKLRLYLVESIALAADQIKEIDLEIAILQSQQLEIDLLHAENQQQQQEHDNCGSG